jgi:glycosyltransferase involved in cell wall biosynthesis
VTLSNPTIAYLAPALTALESTFVYDELLALEREGVRVVPVSVHRPDRFLVGHDDLLVRTHYLYDRGHLRTFVRSFASCLRLWRRHGRSLRWLVADIREIGLFRAQAWKLIYQYLVAGELARILVEKDCRHLHIHFAHVPTQIGMYAAAMAGIPFTVMAHANDIFERGLLLERKAERAAKLLTISEYNRAHLESIGVSPARLAVMRCGVSFSAGEMPPSRQRRLSYRIGTLGRLVEKKGVDDLIRAVGRLGDRVYRIELSIAGDGPLRGMLEGLVAQLGLADRVRFEGSMSHARVKEWMDGLDAFVLACKQDANGDMDGIPVVLMEAMSQFVPVISTRLSGISELVVDGETGLLANPGDPSGLAAQIHRLLDAPELRCELAARAEAHVRGEFGQQVNLERLLGHMGIAIRQ